MEYFNRYFLDTIKNRYAQFEGRASRSEFWYFALFYFLIDIVAILIDSIINPIIGVAPEQASQGGFVQMILALGLLIPSIALAIRRLHDIGKSGWWYLLIFIPVIGWLILLYFYILDSQPGNNIYGENPKGL